MLVRTTGLLVLAAVAIGCSNGPGNRGEAAPTPDTKTNADNAAAIAQLNPLAAFTSETPSEVVRLEIAHERLISSCMRQRGFSFAPALSAVPTDDAAAVSTYSLLDPATARSQGYGIADNYRVAQAGSQAGSRPQQGQNAPGYIAALAGTTRYHTTIRLPEGHTVSFNSNGCVSIALTHLYGDDWNTVYYTVSDLQSKIVYDVSHTPQWTAATQRWSSCMKQRTGHSFAEPEDARAAVNEHVQQAMRSTPAATQPKALAALRHDEVVAAEVDADCQVAAGLLRAVSDHQPGIQSSYETKYSQLLAAYRRDLTHARAYLRTQRL